MALGGCWDCWDHWGQSRTVLNAGSSGVSQEQSQDPWKAEDPFVDASTRNLTVDIRLFCC